MAKKIYVGNKEVWSADIYDGHINDKQNPHETTKGQTGAEAALASHNTAEDAHGDIRSILNEKVDKEVGKGLSDENYTLDEKSKVANVPLDTNAQLEEKVDKVDGKGLSTEDYTTEEKAKVANLPLDTSSQLADKVAKTEVGILTNLLTTAKTSIVNAINELFNNKANKVQEAWITPTLLNGWVAETGYTVAYMKDEWGFVHFKGRVKNGSIAFPIFNLPLSYRPLQDSYCSAITGATSGVNFIGALKSTGNVVPASTAGNTFIILDGLSYRTV